MTTVESGLLPSSLGLVTGNRRDVRYGTGKGTRPGRPGRKGEKKPGK